MDILARKEDYLEAYQIQIKIHAMEKEENPKYAHDRVKKISSMVSQFKQKQ